jgi:pimeloyl-ACP methyl ester carboxylesterase
MAPQTQLVELIDARTSDGVTLSGALAEPPAGSPARLPFDAALMVHGAAATFYDGFFRTFSAALVDRGIATLRANNRGHDVVNRGDGRGRFLGVALEAIDDCPLDFRAWLDVLAARGYRRILVFGHSLGAIKSAYFLAAERDPRVTGCVLASPPRFNTERMLASERGAEFAATIAAAEAEIAAGRPDAFIRTTYPRREFAAAHAYLAKYATATRFDVFEHVASMPVPVLALTGSEELGDPNFRDHPAGYAAARERKSDLDFEIVPDGDHHYSRAQTFAVQTLLAWIDRLSESRTT